MELPDEVREVADRVALMGGVEGVLLGGSRAGGTATATSDWDLGVYYREPVDLTPLAELGPVHPPGSWGRLMNGGAWLDLGGTRVDVLLRDMAVVEHWTAAAGEGRYEVDGLLGYLAGFPTYTLTAEVAESVVLSGRVPVRSAFPPALRLAAPARWRFHRDFSLYHARRAAALGNGVVALGQLARSVVEEAHARHCAAGRWVLNEKRIQAATGLPTSLPTGEPVQVVEAVAAVLCADDG